MNPVWHLFPVTVEDGRDALREHLNIRGILSGVHYPRMIPDQAAMAAYGHYEVACDLMNTRRLTKSELSLPIHPFLQDNEVDTVIDACNNWTP